MRQKIDDLRNFSLRRDFHVQTIKLVPSSEIMKNQLTLLAGVVALVLGSQVARAEGEEKKGDKPERGPAKERILGKFDTDKDGALSKTEIAAMPERMSKNLLEKWDTDKNGELSKTELDAIKAPEGGKDRPKREEKKEEEKK